MLRLVENVSLVYNKCQLKLLFIYDLNMSKVSLQNKRHKKEYCGKKRSKFPPPQDNNLGG